MKQDDLLPMSTITHRGYLVGFSAFRPTMMRSTSGLSGCREVFIFLASARPAIFAASWVAKPPSRSSIELSEIILAHCAFPSGLGGHVVENLLYRALPSLSAGRIRQEIAGV